MHGSKHVLFCEDVKYAVSGKAEDCIPENAWTTHLRGEYWLISNVHMQ
jgi:hypothetical protein